MLIYPAKEQYCAVTLKRVYSIIVQNYQYILFKEFYHKFYESYTLFVDRNHNCKPSLIFTSQSSK